MKKLIPIILLFFMVSFLWAAPQNFYVTKSGNDGNDGSSWADGDAWLTIVHAADTADPGNGTPITIHVAAGTYAEQVDFNIHSGVDDDNRIILDGDVENASGDGATRPIIDGEGTRNFCISITKHYITIADFEAKTPKYHGFTTDSSTYTDFIRCVAHDCPYEGFYVAYKTSAYDAYNRAIDCVSYDNGRMGFAIIGGKYSKMYNSVSFSNDSRGIQVGSGATYGTIKNCISHDNPDWQIRVESDCQTGFVSDYNDIYKDTGNYAGAWGSTDCSALSDWQTASSQDANSQEGDPLYVDEAGKDFHITDTDSPCSQNGTDLSGIFTIDYDQDTWVTWSIGMDYIVGVAPPAAVGAQSQTLILE